LSDNYNGIGGAYSDSNTVNENTVSDNEGIGIDFVISNSNTINNNIITNNGRCGVRLITCSSNSLNGNTVSGAGYDTYGFAIWTSSNSNELSGNIVSGYTQGFYFVGNNNIVTGNTVTETTGVSIRLYGSSNNIVSGNTLAGNGISSNGISLWYYSTGNTISTNIISGMGVRGIWLLTTCNDNIINDNVVSDTINYYGIYLDGSSNIVTGNTLSGNGHGISLGGYGSSNTITGNTVSGNIYGFSLYKDSNSNTISGNTVSGNSYNGIRLEYSSSNTVTDNMISDNGQRGIFLYYSNNNIIFHNNIINNGISAYDSNPEDNNWHHPVLLEGNYWSDYLGWDDGSGTDKHAIAGDRIGDTIIPHPGTDYDFYPFTTLSGWLNEPPVIDSISGPVDPVAVGTSFVMTGDFTDPNLDDTHTATWTWGDGSTTDGTVDQVDDTVTGSNGYDTPGVYMVSLEVVDSFGESDSMTWTQYVVVYDPTGAFITGGGTIDSPEGAYVADASLTGKAGFGFVSKYQKGATTPSGNTQFRFHAGDLSFKSESYNWLVIAGAKGQFKGTGTINGAGEYGFMLSAIDSDLPGGGDADKFRIKIWDMNTEIPVYDNQVGEDDDYSDPTTGLTHGSIKIHKG
jgi:parallel beta-helix repeat protein